MNSTQAQQTSGTSTHRARDGGVDLGTTEETPTLMLVFEAIRQIHDAGGEPTRERIVTMTGLKPTTVDDRIKVLRGEGMISPHKQCYRPLHQHVAAQAVSCTVTRLKVALSDVPSSSSFRAQQLSALSEAVKALPPQMQQVVMPFMLDLMDLPRKEEIIKVIKEATQQTDPEQLRKQIEQELQRDLKERELDLREREVAAREKLMGAQQVQTGVQAAYSAMQGGAQVAQMPMIAPIADAIMQSAGYQKPNPGGDDPDFPTVPGAAPVPAPLPVAGQGGAAPEQGASLEVRKNTSPAFPPVPQEPSAGMQGIETPSTGDNLQPMAAP